MHRIFILCVLICFPLSIYAESLTFTVSNTPNFSEQEYLLTASFSGVSIGKEYYIKGAFFSNGSSNYFGYTKSEESWIKNSLSTKQQKKIVYGQWNNELHIRPDFQDTGFHGSGDYSVKIGYYSINSEGNPSSVKWSDTITMLTLLAPTLTPVPTDTPLPTETPKPISTPIIYSTQKYIPTLRPTDILTENDPLELHEEMSQEILGQTDDISSIIETNELRDDSSLESFSSDIPSSPFPIRDSTFSESLNESTSSPTTNNSFFLSLVLIGTGIIVLALVSIMNIFWKKD